ncbi:MAG: cyclopropane-fatty-acyl-phospholipid synthase family protein [Hyphomicrobiaceae bacterium]|nr:cyclopropane-fatty-acyl-phospholipid synthase family protein [Hyphomicrobiaceae bacterium]
MTSPEHDLAKMDGDVGRRRVARLVDRLIGRLPSGCIAGRLIVRLPGGQELVRKAPAHGPEARVTLVRWRGVRRIITGGHIGFAEAYIAGDIDSPNLEAVFAWALANEPLLDRAWQGSELARLISKLRHRLNANTRRGSRRNIAAHYDLGNDFYAAWLDRSMQYSSALYTSPNQSLEEAQQAKLDRITELLDLRGGERVLEIGCGWGAVAEHLAGRHRCEVTALTLSREQADYTSARLQRAGLGHLVDVRLEDYRAATGTFDRVVSIEMIEAVGQRFWPVYFQMLQRSLAPGGRIVLQAITCGELRFCSYVREPDFIQRYIFPGGMLPTSAAIAREAANAGLAVESVETFGASYARTLEDWRMRFVAAWPRLQAPGFDDRFRRMWIYYLDYCIAGFRSGEIDVGLYALRRA